MTTKDLKIVVFDLDETLGYFVEFGGNVFSTKVRSKKNKHFQQEINFLLHFD